MAITPDFKSQKVTINLAKGSQTVSGLNTAATNEGIYAVAEALFPLINEEAEEVLKVKTETLINA